MTSVSEISTSLVGTISPFITHIIRRNWLCVHDTAAHWLSLSVSTVCVGIAYMVVNQKWDTVGFLGNVGLAFTLSQVVYMNVSRKILPPVGP